MSGTVAWAEPKKRMTKRHSGTEPATKTVAEVAHARRAGCGNGALQSAQLQPGA